MSYNTDRAKQIINVDLSTLSKKEINALRQELINLIKWWRVTPIHELRAIGLFGTLAAMLEKEKDMLDELKK